MRFNTKQYTQGANATSVGIERLELHKDEDMYYLSGKIKVEDTYSIRVIDVPKIYLPITPGKVRIDQEHDPFFPRCDAFIDLGFGKLRLLPTMYKGHEVLFTETVVEEKHVEMTLDEIEKKLGHKVKIVNK